MWNEGGAVEGEKSSSSRGTYIILSDILGLSESYSEDKIWWSRTTRYDLGIEKKGCWLTGSYR